MIRIIEHIFAVCIVLYHLLLLALARRGEREA